MFQSRECLMKGPVSDCHDCHSHVGESSAAVACSQLYLTAPAVALNNKYDFCLKVKSLVPWHFGTRNS